MQPFPVKAEAPGPEPACRIRVSRGILMLVVCAAIQGLVSESAAADSLYTDKPIPIFLQQPTATAFMSYRIEDEKRVVAGEEREKDDTSLRLRLDLRTQGWIYHPALVNYQISLRPEFKRQTQQARGTPEQSTRGDIFGYDISTIWLGAKPYSVELSSGRNRSDASASGVTDVITETQHNRAALNLRYPIFPTTISYVDQTTNTEDFFHTQIQEKTWLIQSDKKTDNRSTNFRAQTTEFQRTISDSASASDRFVAFLTDNYTTKNGARFFNSLRFTDTSSTGLSSTRLGFSSNLLVPHTKKFSTRYSLDWHDAEDQFFTSTSTRISTGLIHQLYDNLRTSFRVQGSKSSQSAGDLNSYGAHLNLSYVRVIPWGSISFRVGGGERIDDNQRVAIASEVRDEAHAFVGISTQIILENINIDTDSIILTSADGLVTYIRGIDYEVQVRGQATVIVRDIFAGIGDDARVLANYRYAANPPAKTGMSTRQYGASLTLWEKFRLYYQENSSKQRLIEGIAPPTLIDDSGSKVGSELMLGWSTTRFEMEDRDSTVLPVKQWRLDQNFRFRQRARVSFGLGAGISETEFKDTGDVSRRNRYSGTLTWRIGSRARFRTRIFYGNVRSDDRRTTEKGLMSSIEWRYGAWRPRLRYELLDVVNVFADETRNRELIYFDVQRFFG